MLRVAFPTSNIDKPFKWVLPNAPNLVLTREPVYTGITRAKHWFTLVETGRGILDEAVTREVMQVSGLRRRR